MLRRVRARGFEVSLDDAGALLIGDVTGWRRGLSWRLPIAEVFDTIVAGLADDPDLLDLDTATTQPDLSDLDQQPDFLSRNYSNRSRRPRRRSRAARFIMRRRKRK